MKSGRHSLRTAVVVVVALTFPFLNACQKAPGATPRSSFEPIASAYLQELRAEEDLAKRTPRLYLYHSPVGPENDAGRYIVLWHEIESHRITLDPALDWPGTFHGRVWVTARTFRKVGATPEAALSARAEEVGSDTAVLVELWEKGAWRQLSRIDWEIRLEDQASSAEAWESLLDERHR